MPLKSEHKFSHKFKVGRACPPAKQSSRPSPANPQPLAFVHVETPEQIRDKGTQRKIRQHVMKTIGQSRRKPLPLTTEEQPRGNRSTVMALEHIPSNPSNPSAAPFYWGDIRICRNFKVLFSAMDLVSKGLISITVDEEKHRNRSCPLKKSSFNPQPGSEQDYTPSLQEIKQYTESLGVVQRLMQPAQSLAARNALIGTIICLAYFDVRVGNDWGWKMHIGGLETMIKSYGGIETLESHRALRLSLFLTDVLGGLVYDTRPRFPQLRGHSMPVYGNPPSPKKVHIQLPLDDASRAIVESAVASTGRLAVLLNYMPRHDTNQLALDLMIAVSITAHDLLSLPRLGHSSSETGKDCTLPPRTPASLTAELVRTSALALVSTVITTASGDDLYCARHRRHVARDLLASTKHQGWAGTQELKVWVLVIQVLMETGPPRNWFLGEIMEMMTSLSLRSWDDLIECLHSVAWVAHAASKEMTRLRLDIEGRLTEQSNGRSTKLGDE